MQEPLYQTAQLEQHYELLIDVLRVLCAVTAPYWLYLLFSYADRDVFTAIILVPLIVLLNVGMVLRLSRGDRFLTRVASLAVFLKIAAGTVYLQMVFKLWNGAADLP